MSIASKSQKEAEISWASGDTLTSSLKTSTSLLEKKSSKESSDSRSARHLSVSGSASSSGTITPAEIPNSPIQKSNSINGVSTGNHQPSNENGKLMEVCKLACCEISMNFPDNCRKYRFSKTRLTYLFSRRSTKSFIRVTKSKISTWNFFFFFHVDITEKSWAQNLF